MVRQLRYGAGVFLSAAMMVAAQPHAGGRASGQDAEDGLNPFNRQYRIRIRALCEEYEWARQQRKNMIDFCRRWLALDDGELRRAVPSQMVPRALYLNRKAGCPDCGEEIFRHGYYPWRMDPETHPWKVQCPVCQEWFPTNDFEAYYLSGLDERNMFVPERADASLLFNTDHPDPDDPLHTYAVDSGTGYSDKKKGSFKFVAHYNHHVNWGANARYPHSRHSIPSAVAGLGYAYAVTGEDDYAHKAAVLLERVADVYPDLDFEYWASKGGYHQYRGIYGTAVDSTWSTRVAYDLARGYALIRDHIRGDDALVRKIETNILRDTFERQKQSIIWGNTGFNEELAIMIMLAASDTALRDEIGAWLFTNAEGEPIPSPHSDWRRTRPGGNLGRIVASLTQDGFSWEGGFGYSAILPLFLTRTYQSLSTFAGRRQEQDIRITMDLLQQRLPAFYENSFQLVCLDRYMPVWGDGGTFATPMIPKGATQANLFAAFAALGDEDIGRMYWRMRGDDSLPTGDLLDPHTHYGTVKDKLESLRDEKGRARRTSRNMPGRGFAVMRGGTAEYERSLIAYYGANTGHNHRETANLYLFAYGLDLMPGLGYPNISNRVWRAGFWDKPISHNTVATEWDSGPEDIRLAHQRLFVSSPVASVTEIDGASVYPQLKHFSRMPVLVTVSDETFYVVDFFRIAGGSDHIYSFHSGVGEVRLEGAGFVPQDGGSYAGEDVPFAVRLEGDGWRTGGGLQFFHDVSRANMDGPVSAEWRLKDVKDVSPFGDEVRLRFTLLSPRCEVALAKSRPPQNIPGNPEDLHYLLARKRSGADEAFVYTGLIEPYLENRRPIASVRLLEVEAGRDLDTAVEVVLSDGRKDIIIQQGPDPVLVTVGDGIRFRGRMLLARFAADGSVSELFAVAPSSVRIEGELEREFTPFAHAQVASFDRGAPASCTLTLDRSIRVPADAIRPFWTDITPSPDANGNYRVESIRSQDGITVLDVGNTSFISGYDQEAQEYRYAFEEGADVVIPFSYHWKQGKGSRP